MIRRQRMSAAGGCSSAGGSHLAPFTSSNPYTRLLRSLESGLPNEVDFGLNVCVILSSSGPHTLQLSRTHRLLELLLGHAGVFADGPVSLRSVFEEQWEKQSNPRNFAQFWKESIPDTKILKLIGYPDLEGGHDVFSPSFFHLTTTEIDAQNVVGQRVLQIASIIRNLSFEPFNHAVLAESGLMVSFIVGCIRSKWAALQVMALDTLSNIAPAMILEPRDAESTQLLFQTLQDCLESEDKFHVMRALETIGNLCNEDANEEVLCELVDDAMLERIISLISVKDIMMCVYLLECLYQISELGEIASKRIAALPHAIETLISLVTIEAVSFGTTGLVGMKVVEYNVPQASAANAPSQTASSQFQTPAGGSRPTQESMMISNRAVAVQHAVATAHQPAPPPPVRVNFQQPYLPPPALPPQPHLQHPHVARRLTIQQTAVAAPSGAMRSATTGSAATTIITNGPVRPMAPPVAPVISTEATPPVVSKRPTPQPRPQAPLPQHVVMPPPLQPTPAMTPEVQLPPPPVPPARVVDASNLVVKQEQQIQYNNTTQHQQQHQVVQQQNTNFLQKQSQKSSVPQPQPTPISEKPVATPSPAPRVVPQQPGAPLAPPVAVVTAPPISNPVVNGVAAAAHPIAPMLQPKLGPQQPKPPVQPPKRRGRPPKVVDGEPPKPPPPRKVKPTPPPSPNSPPKPRPPRPSRSKKRPAALADSGDDAIPAKTAAVAKSDGTGPSACRRGGVANGNSSSRAVVTTMPIAPTTLPSSVSVAVDQEAEIVAKNWLIQQCIVDPQSCVNRGDLYTNYTRYIQFSNRPKTYVSASILSNLVVELFPSASCVPVDSAANCMDSTCTKVAAGASLKVGGVRIDGIRFLNLPSKSITTSNRFVTSLNAAASSRAAAIAAATAASEKRKTTTGTGGVSSSFAGKTTNNPPPSHIHSMSEPMTDGTTAVGPTALATSVKVNNSSAGGIKPETCVMNGDVTNHNGVHDETNGFAVPQKTGEQAIRVNGMKDVPMSDPATAGSHVFKNGVASPENGDGPTRNSDETTEDAMSPTANAVGLEIGSKNEDATMDYAPILRASLLLGKPAVIGGVSSGKSSHGSGDYSNLKDNICDTKMTANGSAGVNNDRRGGTSDDSSTDSGGTSTAPSAMPNGMATHYQAASDMFSPVAGPEPLFLPTPAVANATPRWNGSRMAHFSQLMHDILGDRNAYGHHELHHHSSSIDVPSKGDVGIMGHPGGALSTVSRGSMSVAGVSVPLSAMSAAEVIALKKAHLLNGNVKLVDILDAVAEATAKPLFKNAAVNIKNGGRSRHRSHVDGGAGDTMMTIDAPSPADAEVEDLSKGFPTPCAELAKVSLPPGNDLHTSNSQVIEDTCSTTAEAKEPIPSAPSTNLGVPTPLDPKQKTSTKVYLRLTTAANPTETATTGADTTVTSVATTSSADTAGSTSSGTAGVTQPIPASQVALQHLAGTSGIRSGGAATSHPSALSEWGGQRHVEQHMEWTPSPTTSTEEDQDGTGTAGDTATTSQQSHVAASKQQCPISSSQGATKKSNPTTVTTSMQASVSSPRRNPAQLQQNQQRPLTGSPGSSSQGSLSSSYEETISAVAAAVALSIPQGKFSSSAAFGGIATHVTTAIPGGSPRASSISPGRKGRAAPVPSNVATTSSPSGSQTTLPVPGGATNASGVQIQSICTSQEPPSTGSSSMSSTMTSPTRSRIQSAAQSQGGPTSTIAGNLPILSSLVREPELTPNAAPGVMVPPVPTATPVSAATAKPAGAFSSSSGVMPYPVTPAAPKPVVAPQLGTTKTTPAVTGGTMSVPSNSDSLATTSPTPSAVASVVADLCASRRNAEALRLSAAPVATTALPTTATLPLPTVSATPTSVDGGNTAVATIVSNHIGSGSTAVKQSQPQPGRPPTPGLDDVNCMSSNLTQCAANIQQMLLFPPASSAAATPATATTTPLAVTNASSLSVGSVSAVPSGPPLVSNPSVVIPANAGATGVTQSFQPQPTLQLQHGQQRPTIPSVPYSQQHTPGSAVPPSVMGFQPRPSTPESTLVPGEPSPACSPTPGGRKRPSKAGAGGRTPKTPRLTKKEKAALQRQQGALAPPGGPPIDNDSNSRSSSVGSNSLHGNAPPVCPPPIAGGVSYQSQLPPPQPGHSSNTSAAPAMIASSHPTLSNCLSSQPNQQQQPSRPALQQQPPYATPYPSQGPRPPGVPPGATAHQYTPQQPQVFRIPAPRPDQVMLACDWNQCGRTFWKTSQVYHHVVSEHLADITSSSCLWAGCDRSSVRLKWSLVTHVNDHHCSEKSLRLAALKKYEQSQCGHSSVQMPRIPPPHPGYAPDAAVSAIKRHAFNHLKKDLSEENEGPVTKSLRLTACLILRNLTRHSAIGRRKVHHRESELAPLLFSRMESAMALTQTLSEVAENGIVSYSDNEEEEEQEDTTMSDEEPDADTSMAGMPATLKHPTAPQSEPKTLRPTAATTNVKAPSAKTVARNH